jgi:hypothetical protein
VSDAPARRAHAAIGWLALLLLICWTFFVHHGVGPVKRGYDDLWYTPRAFLFENATTQELLASPALAFALLGAPALVLAGAVAVASGSALALALALSCVLATLLFTFYGTRAPLPWEFFGWRGSAVLCSVALAVGSALAAPWLARSWRARSLPVRVALYAPIVIGAIVLLRNVTGTNEALPFAISPWPAVPVFGLEVGALGIATILAGAGLGGAGAARFQAHERPRGAALCAAGVLLPALLLLAASRLGLLPFHLSAARAVGSCVLCAALIAVASRRPPGSALSSRALALSALLLGAPVLLGQAWAWLDYERTREQRARLIIDALHAYLDRESLYPDRLEDLVKAGLLARIPDPVIGFPLGRVDAFDYASYGTSYLLDFSAPRWVQCHYTPAPILEDLDEEERAELAADGGLEESWSCPSTPPELW